MSRLVAAVLLDVEGTTTPITFVHEVLFPYARARLGAFVATHGRRPEVAVELQRLAVEHAADRASSKTPPPLPFVDGGDVAVDSAARYLEWLIDHDRKVAPLKSLQGYVWEAGYRDGSLRGEVYADVAPALTSWRERGLVTAIYSSGSVLAQKLLFGHSTGGDLTPLLTAHFDTAVGAKGEVTSYRRIAGQLGIEAGAIAFVSDVVAEFDAAAAAGLQTRLSVRPGNPAQPPSSHQVIRSFAELGF